MANSRYQYETSPRKLEPDYKRKKQKKNIKVVKEQPKNKSKISKEQKKNQVKMTVGIIGIFLLLLTISCRNSQIDKQFTNIQNQRKELSSLQKENEQLKVNIENSLNLNNIEKVAKEELGMEKLTSKQTIYIALPKKDYVESASEKVIIEEEKNWLEKFFAKLLER